MKLSRRSVLRGSAVALAAPALDTLGLTPLTAPAAAQQADEWRHGLSLFGEVKYPAGFKHFDYVNPQAPKGGTARMIAIGTLRQFQHGGVGRARFDRRRTEPHLQHADGGRARRGVHRIRPVGRIRETSAGLLERDLSAARRCALARRQAGHRRGRDLLDRIVQEASSAICRLLPPRHQGREDRRARRDLHLRQSRQSRAAADRRPALCAAQALVGRHRRQRQQARHRSDQA